MQYQDNERIWQLLARKTAKEILPEEVKELERLLQQHPYALHVQELMNQDWYDQFKSYNKEDISLLLEKHKLRLSSVTEKTALHAITATEEINNRRGARMLFRYITVAASIMLVVFIGWKWQAKPVELMDAKPLQHLVTQMGSRSQLLLPDGTKVWLNAGSSLDYPKQFDGKTRDVQLEGEAYFDVVKDSGKPFFVHTKAFTVKVVGTIFNIRAYADEDSAVASLIHGSVEVRFNKNEDNIILLQPNEKLTVAMPAKHNGDIKTAASPDEIMEEKIYVKKTSVTTMKDSTIAETAWVENKLVFKNMPFAKIASLLEKWFNAEIRFKNENKKSINLSGTFEEESLEDILRAFQLTGTSFQYKKGSDGVIWIE
ncbi:FecR family protein [Agriterribacter sp.]|uniref:FecR family protein n=1 Tax=Agriterribacter sp. TaxID=2821509 RepID=UPI002CB4432F|nr:FecR domain-containing protein [Agriterribacter sp.]HTN05456.1 FecR domain-containing protein [Agriterribacter sp.]